MSLAAKRWAKLADEQQFKQLATVQATAANWRTGLIALTALLTAVTIIKGPEAAADLSTPGRIIIAVLLGLALLALLFGSGAAMYAAYGFPSRDQLLTGESLRTWSANEAKKSRKWLVAAVASFFAAVPLIGAAIAVGWFDQDWFPADPPALLYVERMDDAQGQPVPPVCGELKSGSAGNLFIKTKRVTGSRTESVRLRTRFRMSAGVS
jgi:hypothetical protein